MSAAVLLLSLTPATAQVFCTDGGVDYSAKCTEQMKQFCDPRFGGANDAQCRRYFGGRPPAYPNNPAATFSGSVPSVSGKGAGVAAGIGIGAAILQELLQSAAQSAPAPTQSVASVRSQIYDQFLQRWSQNFPKGAGEVAQLRYTSQGTREFINELKRQLKDPSFQSERKTIQSEMTQAQRNLKHSDCMVRAAEGRTTQSACYKRLSRG